MSNKHTLWADAYKIKSPIHVIGLGAVGSHLVDLLVAVGIKPYLIHGYDFDVVDSNNIDNQIYFKDQVEMYKVDALNQYLANKYEKQVTLHNMKFEDQPVSGIVIMAVDTLEGREQIARNCLSYPVDKIFDIRIGIHHYELYNINNTIDEVNNYINNLPSEDQLESNESACGTTTLAKPLAVAASAITTNQLIKVVLFNQWNTEEGSEPLEIPAKTYSLGI